MDRPGTAAHCRPDGDTDYYVNRCATAYLSDSTLLPSAGAVGWTIRAGCAVLAGRGVVATKDYGEGDVIFVDAPLIVSPRVLLAGGGDQSPNTPVCPVCYGAPARVSAVRPCPDGCRLPVCSKQCSSDPVHADECRYVRLLRPRTDRSPWSVGIYNAVTAIRGLAVNRGRYKYFLDILQKKSTDRPAFEVGAARNT